MASAVATGTAAVGRRHGQVCEALGTRFQVVGAPEVVEAADAILADLALPTGPGPGADADPPVTSVQRYEVTADAVHVDGERFDAHSVAQALELVQWHLNQSIVARLTRSMTGLHAAAAAHGDRLVVLPADSGSGKSTTVAALVRAGWRYQTDEACFIDPHTLEALPYPKPIGLEHGSWHLFPETVTALPPRGTWLVPASCLGSGGPAGPMRPAAVVAPRYEAGSPTRLRRLSPGELVMHLAQSTFSFNADGARHLGVLARLARVVPGYALTVGDLTQAVDMITHLVRGREV